MILYYVHDPMCSWCWGFSRSWQMIKSSLPPSIKVKYVLGGLAPDSDELMPQDQQEAIAGYWKKIQEAIPGVKFNYDFWRECKPRRSTFPACRAVLAAQKQNISIMYDMINRIQKAYYLEAKNPSDDKVLIDLAKELGLNVNQFMIDLNSLSTQKQLEIDIQFYNELASVSGIRGFPSLALQKSDNVLAVPIDYNQPSIALDFIQQHN